MKRAVLLLVVAITACRSGRPGEDPLVLAGVFNLTGSQKSLDLPSSHGARLAVEQANRERNRRGKPAVELVIVDGRSDAGEIATRVEALLDERPDIAALFGLSDTDMVLAAAPVASRHRRAFLTSGATSPELPDEVQGLFLACFGDNVQAAAAAEWAFHDRGARRVAILCDETMSYTRLLRRYFGARFTELGGEIISATGYAGGALPVVDVGEADLVYVCAGPDRATECVRLLRDGGFDGPILGGDAFDAPQVWKHEGVGELLFTTHAYLGEESPDPKIKAFRKSFEQAYDGASPDAFAALGYDAAWLLMTAATIAGSVDPDAVHRALAEIRRFEGVTGVLSYAEGEAVPTKSVTIVGVREGKLRLVRQFTPELTRP